MISGQALPRLAVDAQGNIAVIWYDTRRDPANHLLDVFGTVSTDGGQTFSPNFRLTDQSFDADAGKFTDATGTDRLLPGRLPRPGHRRRHGLRRLDRHPQRQPGRLLHALPHHPGPRAAQRSVRAQRHPADGDRPGHGRPSEHLPKLAIPAGDNDWFRLQAAATGNLTVTATPSDPRLGLQVELWDASGTTLLASGSAVTGQGGQQLVFAGQSGTSYLVHVAGPARRPRLLAISPQYTLDVTSLTADLGNLVYQVQDGYARTRATRRIYAWWSGRRVRST